MQEFITTFFIVKIGPFNPAIQYQYILFIYLAIYKTPDNGSCNRNM
jgi:hypothetical protein